MTTDDKRVYIVTEGSYSDYRIVSVWTTHEEAEKHLPKNQWGEAVGIEEWLLNENEQREVVEYSAFMAPDLDEPSVSGPNPTNNPGIGSAEKRGSRYGDGWHAWGYGPTPEHAIKSASDALAKARAEENGL